MPFILTLRINDPSLIQSLKISPKTKNLDLILVLDKDQIVDQGNHMDLIMLPSYYKQMWQLHNKT